MEYRMKRTLLAAVFGGLFAVVSSAFPAQAAPLSAVKSVPAAENTVQQVEYTYRYRRHHHHHGHRHRHYRPVERWHNHHHYVRPYYLRRHHHHHHHWTHRHHRRHYH